MGSRPRLRLAPVQLAPGNEALWPHLRTEGYSVTSPPTWNYNCIAFAAGLETEWWWPDPNSDAAWPRGVPCEETLEAFAAAFATLGYEICADGELEQGYEKVAIYAQNGVPTHAAKQLDDGRWKSKLGAWEDIEHNTLKAVEEHIYGRAALFLSRKVSP